MSAFIVDKAHIDAMVTAAASVRHGAHDSGLSWWATPDPDFEAIYAESGRDAYYAALASERRELSYFSTTRASEVGMMLWAENVASIHHRYPDTAETDDGYPGPVSFNGEATVGTYTFRRTRDLSPVVVLKAIACYEYQTCEHPGWATSEARSFCRELQGKMIRELEGYDQAPWELQEADVRQVAFTV